MIFKKKMVLIMLPVLCVGALVGCSNKPTDDNPKQQEQVQQSKIKYSADFKNKFLEIGAMYNDMEEFQENYKLVEWDDKDNKPVLNENTTVTELSSDKVIFKNTTKMTDMEAKVFKLKTEAETLSLEISEKFEKDDKAENYKNTAEWKRYEELIEEYSIATEEYYNATKAEKEKEEEKEKEKTVNSTVTAKCLIYGLIGGGEEIKEVLDDNFSMLGLLAQLSGTAPTNEYFNFLFENIYITSEDGKTVYGRLSYNRDVDTENKELVQSFTFKKYSKSMDKEIEEYKEKSAEFEKAKEEK